MAVPVGGNFKLFDPDDNTTIQGAIIEGGADSIVVSNTNDFNELIQLSDFNKYDPIYYKEASSLSEIKETVQFRGYPILGCNGLASFSGGSSYPSQQTINLGTDAGDVSFSFEAFSQPDRFIVEFNGAIVIDTGYRGISSYDFGGASRSSFNASLNGKIDPILETTYPDISNFPDDGFPRVISPGNGTSTFLKNTSTPTTAKISVYGPMIGTAWNYTLGCPVPIPITMQYQWFHSMTGAGESQFNITGTSISVSDILTSGSNNSGGFITDDEQAVTISLQSTVGTDPLQLQIYENTILDRTVTGTSFITIAYSFDAGNEYIIEATTS